MQQLYKDKPGQHFGSGKVYTVSGVAMDKGLCCESVFKVQVLVCIKGESSYAWTDKQYKSNSDYQKMKLLGIITCLRWYYPFGISQMVIRKWRHTVTYNETRDMKYIVPSPVPLSRKHGIKVLNNDNMEVGQGSYNGMTVLVIQTGTEWMPGDRHTLIGVCKQTLMQKPSDRVKQILEKANRYDVHGNIIDGSHVLLDNMDKIGDDEYYD